MISLLAQTLVLSGVLILAGVLFPVRRLTARLPPGSVRNLWYSMTILIVLFIAGYLGYIWHFWNSHSNLLDLIVPGVYFLGACFVWLTAMLSLRTAVDLMRINRLEQETITDPLTAVFNRRYLDLHLGQEVAKARRYALQLIHFWHCPNRTITR